MITTETAAAGTTGRYLVLLRQGKEATEAGVKILGEVGGGKVARASDFAARADAGDPLAEVGTAALLLDTLGVAVLDAPPEGVRTLSRAAAGASAILAVEPERIVHALSPRVPLDVAAGVPPTLAADDAPPRPSLDYLQGYRDAVNHLVDRLLADDEREPASRAAPPTIDADGFTWGLIATRVNASSFSGKGVRLAVLDTGFDSEHPDFLGRTVVTRSFVDGEEPEDGHGHGTHCIGTACGSFRPGVLPRYGVAFDAEIYAGKVLSNRGSGGDGGILAGIEWAITNGCAVISMSLGAATEPGQSFSRVFETVARRALAADTLIVAAAGNESRRPEVIASVGHPANCPSIMAVGALDRRLRVAPFSCGGLTPEGGQVDVAAPGVDVRSSWPRPELYRSINGTSMATPHVAGIAALHAEADPTARGAALWTLLTRTARRLPRPARDVGSGLVQAP